MHHQTQAPKTSVDSCRSIKVNMNVSAVREVIADVCAHKKDLETTKSVLMDVGDNFMISNQEVQVDLVNPAFCIQVSIFL